MFAFDCRCILVCQTESLRDFGTQCRAAHRIDLLLAGSGLTHQIDPFMKGDKIDSIIPDMSFRTVFVHVG